MKTQDEIIAIIDEDIKYQNGLVERFHNALNNRSSDAAAYCHDAQGANAISTYLLILKQRILEPKP